ncbi:hypothetical protein Tco_0823868 [Tanacetum coccineum]|uniref:Reverse transcriptase domain-containing protein n=1 Tax=Tanacetum coccineum TaxID=301880 RepID=A0ABQ5ANR1_9ASTR
MSTKEEHQRQPGNQAGKERAFQRRWYVVGLHIKLPRPSIQRKLNAVELGSFDANNRMIVAKYKRSLCYMEKGFPIFLAHVTAKEVEDKSEKKRLEDVPIVQNFPEVFPEDLPGLLPTQQVEFQIDLVPGAAPV